MAEEAKQEEAAGDKKINKLADVADEMEELIVKSELSYSDSLRVLRAVTEMLQERALSYKVEKPK